MDPIFSNNDFVPFTFIFATTNLAIMVIVASRIYYTMKLKKSMISYKSIADIQIMIASFCK